MSWVKSIVLVQWEVVHTSIYSRAAGCEDESISGSEPVLSRGAGLQWVDEEQAERSAASFLQ